jgi:hypothetical protein
MPDTLPLVAQFGTHYQTEKIINNCPSWWDTTPGGGEDSPGSNFYALLSAVGESDWGVGGFEPRAIVDTGLATSVAANTLNDTSKSWDGNKFVGMWLEDMYTLGHTKRVKYRITANTATSLTIQTTTAADGTVITTPLKGAYRIITDNSAMSDLRADIFLRTAEYLDLDNKGFNVAVTRPSTGMSDTLYRKLIPLLSWGQKLLRPSIENVLAVLFGTAKGDGWDCFEIRNREIVIDIYTTSVGLPNGLAFYMRSSVSVAGTTNPVTSYLVSDVYQRTVPDGLTARGAFLAGKLVLNNGDVIDERLIQLILRRYCRAAGVAVKVNFLGA